MLEELEEMVPDGEKNGPRCVVFNELTARWQERSSWYSCVYFGTALGRYRDSWKNIVTFFLPLGKTEQRDTDDRANYGDLLIASGRLSVVDATRTLEKLVNTGHLELPELPAVRFTVSSDPNYRTLIGSHQRRFPLVFPYLEYRFSAVGDDSVMAPQQRVVAVDLPLFPSGTAAIEHLLTLRLGQDAYRGNVFALVPDYRARLASVTLGARGGRVKIEVTTGCSEADVIGKAYSQSFVGIPRSQDLVFQNGEATFTVPGFPRYMTMVLLSKSRQDQIDEWFFDATVPSLRSGVTIEAQEEISALIMGGESEELEFKRQIPPNKADLAKAVTAMANYKGGRVLIGVDDNCVVSGCEAEKVGSVIRDVLRAHCDPCPEFDVQTVSIEEKQVVAINVPAGTAKPYCVRDHGIFIRAGASTRQATRYELDQMYDRKEVSLGGWRQ